MPIPVALFVRVSKKSQNYERQVADLTTYANRNDMAVTHIIHEKGSATKRKNIDRPELDELLTLCRSQAIRKVLVSELSRLGRKRGETPQLIEEISEMGVSIYAHNLGLETLLPTGRRNPVTGIIVAVMTEIYANETETLSDRILSGQAEARKNNKRIGRPEGSTKSGQQILDEYPGVVKDLKAGLSIRQSAAFRNVAKGTVEKVKRVMNSLNQA